MDAAGARDDLNTYDPVLLAARLAEDPAASAAFNLVDDSIDAPWAVDLIPQLLDELCPPVEQTRQRASFLIKREIFEKTFGQQRTDKDVAEELGYSVRWVRECRTDLLNELLPMIWRHYRLSATQESTDTPEAPPSSPAV